MFSTPAVVGDVVCVGSCAGVFYSLDRSTGALRGQHDVFGPDSIHREFHGDALLQDSLLLIGTDTHEGDTAYVFALEPETAELRWRRAMGPGVRGDIARWRDRCYAVSLMDELVCFDPLSGGLHWSYRPELAVYNPHASSPRVVEDHVVYADRDGTIRAFDAATGRLLWRTPQVDPVSTWPVQAESSLVFVRGDDALIRLDPATGQERSRTRLTGGPYVGATVVVGDSLLLVLGSSTLMAFDLQRNQVRWSRSARHEWTSSRPYVWRDMVLSGDRGQLIAYALADGAVRWTYPIQGTVRGIGVHGDTLYVGTLKGEVHALVNQRVQHSR